MPPGFTVPEPTDVAALMPDELPLTDDGDEADDPQDELPLDDDATTMTCKAALRPVMRTARTRRLSRSLPLQVRVLRAAEDLEIAD